MKDYSESIAYMRQEMVKQTKSHHNLTESGTNKKPGCAATQDGQKRNFK